MTIHPADFLTIGLLVVLEGLLSADNALVLAILVLGLPKTEQKKALRYGIGGAFAFRTVAVFLVVHLMRLGWVKLAGGAYLLYLTYKHFFTGGDAEARRGFKPARPWLGLSPLWATVVKVELTDVVFAVDSILVGVAMSQKTWVVISGGILGIIMMRVVIAQLLALVQRYPGLVDGAFVIIGWVGAKLLVEYGHQLGLWRLEIPTWFSLTLIVVIFGVALLIARRQEIRARRKSRSVDEQATKLLSE